MRREVRRCSRTCDLQTADVLVRRPNLTLHVHTAGLEKHTHTHSYIDMYTQKQHVYSVCAELECSWYFILSLHYILETNIGLFTQ